MKKLLFSIFVSPIVCLAAGPSGLGGTPLSGSAVSSNAIVTALGFVPISSGDGATNVALAASGGARVVTNATGSWTISTLSSPSLSNGVMGFASSVGNWLSTSNIVAPGFIGTGTGVTNVNSTNIFASPQSVFDLVKTGVIGSKIDLRHTTQIHGNGVTLQSSFVSDNLLLVSNTVISDLTITNSGVPAAASVQAMAYTANNLGSRGVQCQLNNFHLQSQQSGMFIGAEMTMDMLDSSIECHSADLGDFTKCAEFQDAWLNLHHSIFYVDGYGNNLCIEPDSESTTFLDSCVLTCVSSTNNNACIQCASTCHLRCDNTVLNIGGGATNGGVQTAIFVTTGGAEINMVFNNCVFNLAYEQPNYTNSLLVFDSGITDPHVELNNVFYSPATTNVIVTNDGTTDFTVRGGNLVPSNFSDPTHVKWGDATNNFIPGGFISARANGDKYWTVNAGSLTNLPTGSTANYGPTAVTNFTVGDTHQRNGPKRAWISASIQMSGLTGNAICGLYITNAAATIHLDVESTGVLDVKQLSGFVDPNAGFTFVNESIGGTASCAVLSGTCVLQQQ